VGERNEEERGGESVRNGLRCRMRAIGWGREGESGSEREGEG
jgi:hypothetical protein